MAIWLIIILLMGILLAFFQGFLVNNNLLLPMGWIIMLICAGLGVRITFFRKKGEKEKHLAEIESLKKQLGELQSSGKPGGE